MAVKTREDVAAQAQEALAEFRVAVEEHRRASEVAAYVPIYRDALRAHGLTREQVAEVQRKMKDAPPELQTYWLLLRRTVKGLKAAILPEGDQLRRLLVMSTGNPDEYRQLLHEGGFKFAEVYVATLAGFVGELNGRDPEMWLDDATRDLNQARQRCLTLRGDLKADVELRQRVLDSFRETFGREVEVG